MFFNDSSYKELIKKLLTRGTSEDINHYVGKILPIAVAMSLKYMLRNDARYLTRYYLVHLDIVEHN